MSKLETIKKVNGIALDIVHTSNSTQALADSLILGLAQAEFDGLDINSVWASIAETNGWSDREAGIEGNPMPKTLANYRSLSRKAIALSVKHQFAKFAEWRKAINAANKLANASEAESKPRIEAINLNELELPGWIERANAIRTGMDTENVKAFDAHLHRAIEAFMQKKAK